MDIPFCRLLVFVGLGIGKSTFSAKTRVPTTETLDLLLPRSLVLIDGGQEALSRPQSSAEQSFIAVELRGSLALLNKI